jgi:hypothetical protein
MYQPPTPPPERVAVPQYVANKASYQEGIDLQRGIPPQPTVPEHVTKLQTFLPLAQQAGYTPQQIAKGSIKIVGGLTDPTKSELIEELISTTVKNNAQLNPQQLQTAILKIFDAYAEPKPEVTTGGQATVMRGGKPTVVVPLYSGTTGQPTGERVLGQTPPTESEKGMSEFSRKIAALEAQGVKLTPEEKKKMAGAYIDNSEDIFDLIMRGWALKQGITLPPSAGGAPKAPATPSPPNRVQKFDKTGRLIK